MVVGDTSPLEVGVVSSFLPWGGVLKRREIVPVGVVVLVMFLMGIVVELVGIGICEARERSEANHFCLVAETGLDVVLDAVGTVIALVSRSYRSFGVAITERTAPIVRPYDGKDTDPWDDDLLILDIGDTFSPPGHAERVALAVGGLGDRDMSAGDLSLEAITLR